MDVRKNVAEVLGKITKAAEASGRNPQEITLVAATKTQFAAVIQEAIEAGVKVCGENRVQEMVANQQLSAYNGADLHFIGHLQRNKAKQVVGHVSLIQSVGSRSLLEEISKLAEKNQTVQDILLEVNISKEETKSGFFVEDFSEICDFLPEYTGINVRGIMAIPPKMENEREQEKIFEKLYNLSIDFSQKMSHNYRDMNCLSMGMSDDYTLAIAQGSTMVRVGTALFGSRHPILNA